MMPRPSGATATNPSAVKVVAPYRRADLTNDLGNGTAEDRALIRTSFARP
jgi:hypothetical protein